MGDFEVVNVNGQLEKNGGNVVSYFCTPKGRVIHAVVGPVSADRLLQEAKWAVERFARGGKTALVRKIEAAHLAALGSDPGQFREEVRTELLKSSMVYQRNVSVLRSMANRRSSKSTARTPLVEARRRAARRIGSDRVHQILAAQPLAPISEVYREFFEELAGEDVNDDRRPVYRAAGLLKLAREQGRPVMLVLYRGGWKSRQYDSATKRLFADLHRIGGRDIAVKSATIVALPLDELPALSNLANVPVYELSRKTSPVVVLSHSDVQPFETIPGANDARHLLERMRALLVSQRLSATKDLIAAGRFRFAESRLRVCERLTKDFGDRQRIWDGLAEVYCAWADSFARDGKTAAALHRARAVQRMNVSAPLRERAGKLMASLSN